MTIAIYEINLSKEAQICLVTLESIIQKDNGREFKGLGTVQEIPPCNGASEVVAKGLAALESCVVRIDTKLWYC